jgi:START-like superfamily domain
MAKKKAGKKQSAPKRPAPAGKKKAAKNVAAKGKSPRKAKAVVLEKKPKPAYFKKADAKGKAKAAVQKNSSKPSVSKNSAPTGRTATKPLPQAKQPAPKPTPPSANGLGVKKSVPQAPSKKVVAATIAAVPVAKASPTVAPTAPKSAPAPKPSKSAERHVPKERVTMEFMVHSAPNVLYELISTPSGFSEWYCDDVNVRGDQFTFMWGGEEEATTLVGRKAPEVVRFHRNNDPDETTFFEFRIRIDAMTNEVALIVTDHALPGEVEETRSLWASQIASLIRVLGA